MSKFSSKVASDGSLARTSYVPPLLAQTLCSWWCSQWEVPVAPSQHPGHTAFHVVSQWQSSHLEKLKEHFAQRKKKKNHECHLLSFVFSWLMEFLFLTCTCKPILPRYKLFWFFTTITSCSSRLDCWRSSMILMSILWEAAFPWVSFYILQGYLYT